MCFVNLDSEPWGSVAFPSKSGSICDKCDVVMSLRGPPSMKPSEALDIHRAAVRAIVAAHRASNARVFGSAARGSDTEASDLDILIDPAPQATLFDIGAIRHELRELLGVSVDVLTPNGLPDSFRDDVLAQAAPI